MKLTKKSLLALLLVMALMCAMLAGCGSTPTASEESAPAEEQSVESTPAEEQNEEPAPAEEPEEEPAPADEEPASADDGGTADLVNDFMNNADEPEEAASLEYDPNGSAVPGTYTFEDYKADMDFSIMWNFTLNEDGSYTLSEDNPFFGVVEYAGQSTELDGNRINCGAMDPDKSTTEGDWAYPTGFSILVNVDDMTFRPENISDEVFGREENEDGEPAGGPGGPAD